MLCKFGKMKSPLVAMTNVSLICIGCGGFYELGNAYVVDNYYEDYATALAANAVADAAPSTTKWLPGLLPPSALDVYERHSLDTNEIWVSFSFSEVDLPIMQASCSKVAVSDVQFPRDPNSLRGAGEVNWWPDTRGLSNRRYDYLRCSGKCWVALDNNSNKAFYWCTL
jgi:hypothetical protein